MDHIITYIKPVSFFKRLFGTTLILVAFYVMFFESLLVSFFMISTGVYLASSSGSQINLENKTYRNIRSLFAIHIGKWRDFPDFEYISVFKGRQKQTVRAVAASTVFSEEVFLINLFYDRNRHETFYRTFDKEDAFKVADHFKLALSLDILDATEKEQKWL